MTQAIVTPEGRLRYARSLWAPRRFQNNPANAAKFSCSIIMNKNDPQMVNLITVYNEAAAAVEDSVAGPAGAPYTLPYGKRSCLMDGAVRFPTEPFYADKWILGCSRAEEDGAPGVLLDANTPVVDKGAIYDGCNVRIHLNFYPYKGGTGGVNAGLFAVMKTGDNDRLGNADPDSTGAFARFQGAGVTTPPPPPAPDGFGLQPQSGVQPVTHSTVPGQQGYYQPPVNQQTVQPYPASPQGVPQSAAAATPTPYDPSVISF